MPPATVNPGSLSFTSRPAGCGYARYPRGRSVPALKIQAATHQASLKRKIKNDFAHCSWASTILYGECRIEELKTAGHSGRHMKEYCHGDESQDDEDSGQEGWRKEEAGQGHESVKLEHEEVAGQESRREKS
jgi:hypothetical protein